MPALGGIAEATKGGPMSDGGDIAVIPPSPSNNLLMLRCLIRA